MLRADLFGVLVVWRVSKEVLVTYNEQVINCEQFITHLKGCDDAVHILHSVFCNENQKVNFAGLSSAAQLAEDHN